MKNEAAFSSPKSPVTGGILGLIPLLRGRRVLLALTVVSGIFAQGGTLASLAIGGWLVGCVSAGPNVQGLINGFILFGIIVMLAAGARWWQAHISHALAFALIETLQVGIYDGLERVAPGSILGRRTGELASIATCDAELMEHFYAHTLADYVGAVAVPLAALAVLFFLHPLLAATLLPFLLLVGSVPYWLSTRAREEGESVMHALGRLNAETVEVIQGQRELAVFGRGSDFVAKLMQLTNVLGVAQRRYSSRAGFEHAAIDALTALAVIATAWTSVLLVRNDALDRALLPLALMLAGGSLTPIVEVTQTARKLGELKAGAARILEIFHQKPQFDDKGNAAMPRAMVVEFKQVGFGYQSDRGDVLANLDFSASPGETVALVGRSGAGKSTTVNLLMRFRDVTSGAISIGGCDIRDIPVSTLRRMIAYVPQDIHLFNETVADNIRLGWPDAPMDKVREAARLAQADAFIEALPQGYETICGEGGVRFSGGQRQRIAIARALLTDAPILVLDEASSSLDAENERAFRRTLGYACGERTVILIAHRPSTIRSADRILVLENGRIVQQGSHEQLVKQGGAYSRLIESEEVLS